MVLGGLWFSDKKPVMSTFLKPFTTSLKELETKGKCFQFVFGFKFIKPV